MRYKARFVNALLVGMIIFPTSAAFADHDGYGNEYGNENDQRRCQGDNCRGSFSPGPFDRSPVDIHDNQVCISPDCSGRSSDEKKE